MDYVRELESEIRRLQTELTKLTIALEVVQHISTRRQSPSVHDQGPHVVKRRRKSRVDVQGQVYNVLAQHDGTPMRSPDIAQLLGWEDKRVQNVLYSMRKAGRIARDHNLAYYIIHSQERVAS